MLTNENRVVYTPSHHLDTGLDPGDPMPDPEYVIPPTPSESAPLPQVQRLTEDEVASLAEAKLRVTLFGPNRTVYARSDQPALQVLLQLRNLYELAANRIEKGRDRPSDLQRASIILREMWHIVERCMIEHNKVAVAKANIDLQRARLEYKHNPQPSAPAAPSRHIVPNPVFDDGIITDG